MIVSFSVANFRSFSSEETLNLVASRRLAQKHEDHEIPIPDSTERVLKTAVLYGANGAGKSNFFKALEYVRSTALYPRTKGSGTGREAFRLGSDPGNEPSSFDLQFIANSKLYRFGFKADDNHIREEWLVQIEASKERILYERVTDETGKRTVDAPGFKGAENLSSLAKVGAPVNQSFLATILAMTEESDLTEELRSILTWFGPGLQLVSPESSYAALAERLATEESFRQFAEGFLRETSTGVEHLKVARKEITEEELRTLIEEPALSQILKEIEKDAENNPVLVRLHDGTEILIEKGDAKRFYRTSIQSMHSRTQGAEVAFKLLDESDGTQRILNLIPALYCPDNTPGVYFIDEIDRSLHPSLVFDFLKLFIRSCRGAQRQVLLTTHESNLLDLDLLRRDEIWFAEKDPGGATRLYSLSDFNVRNDLQIRKHYLQGRFGGIPFLGNLERLFADQGCVE